MRDTEKYYAEKMQERLTEIRGRFTRIQYTFITPPTFVGADYTARLNGLTVNSAVTTASTYYYPTYYHYY